MIFKRWPDEPAQEQELDMLINTIPSIAFALAAACLAGCAASVDASGPGSAGISAQGGTAAGAMMAGQAACGMGASGMAQGAAGCGMQHMDREAMCAMYRGMRDAPTEAARQEMMEQRMSGMSPETRQRHMEMMRQHCQ
jgi:hypothetical protein